MADKELLLQLQSCFDRCRPIFIAMGDEVRLTIITALAQTALTGHSPADTDRLLRSGHSPADTGRLLPSGRSPADTDRLPVSDHTPKSHPKGLSVKEITNTTRLSRPAVSHHLKILKDSGMIDSVQTGTSNIYYLTFDATTELLHRLTSILYEIRGLE